MLLIVSSLSFLMFSLSIEAAFNDALYEQRLLYKKLQTDIYQIYLFMDKFLSERLLKSNNHNI